VKLELMLMFAQTDDMRKHGLQSPESKNLVRRELRWREGACVAMLS